MVKISRNLASVRNRKIIVALDGMTPKEALIIAKTLKSKVWGYKINDLVYSDENIISRLKRYGKIFVDVKLHDIPNTVANTINRISKRNVDFITIHASGGISMMKKAVENKGNSKIIAVKLLRLLS